MPEETITLKSIFNDNCSYYISKIYDGIDYHASDREYGKINLNMIKDILKSFKMELEKYHSLDYFDTVNHLYKEISYPLDKLEDYFKGSKTINKQTARIFTYFISHKMKELKLIATEIDEDMKKLNCVD